MSDHDELDELARALRAMTDEAPASTVASTRARVVASATRRSGRPSWALAAAVGLAVVLGGSTVWAFFTGRIGWPAETSEAQPEVERDAVADPPARAAGGELPVEPGAQAAESEPTRAAVSEPGPTTDEPAARTARAAVELGSASAESAASTREIASEHDGRDPDPDPVEPEEPIDPAERRAYDAAHALHFVEGDWPGAIRAWDAYLAAFPRGRFGLEARYNRALALVHAGRFAEARDALTPFADGRFGAYRRSEARALLDAIADEPAR